MTKGPLLKAYHPSPKIFMTMFLAFVISLITSLAIARAQDGPEHGIMSNGDAAVTGFSGTIDRDGQLFINPDGASLKVMDLNQRGQARGQVINAPTKFEAFARDVGQVFGVALDNASPPNIYVTASSAYGLSLVTPDSNGDGIPEKATNGSPDATFMPGQFGLGGGSGSVWKIDGKSGAVSLFATIENSTAGLGNIAFDATHYQFFVSDLESGLVHRLNMNGDVLDTFDHGATGRPAGGLDAVENDPTLKADITAPEFDTENADTWGLADVRRRVWGLTFYNGRLYYSPTEGPQVWSVGIKPDGSFADDATLEIQTVPGGFPVSDMLFTSDGKMILSQRGGQLGSADYSQFQTPGNNAVLRYRRDETGRWVQEPQQFAIGFPPDFKNASGGIGLACANILWSTGDNLRNDASLVDRLSQGGELVVHGLQGNRANAVRPKNTPPFQSWFVDFDSQFNDPEKAGQVGDVEIYRNCPARAEGGYEESWPGWTPEWIPPEGWVPPHWWPRFPDLRLIKRNTRCDYVGKSLIVECNFKLIVTNVGAVVYTGPLSIVDNVPAGFKFIPPAAGNIPWACQQPGGTGQPISCDSANIETLFPGHSKTLILTMRKFGGKKRRFVKNCAILEVPDDNLFNNEDCGFGKTPPPVLRFCPRGWSRYPTQGSVPQGWESRRFGDLICAKPGKKIPPVIIPEPGPECRPGETRFGNPADVPAGWRSRRVSHNGRTIWCGKPGKIVDPFPPGPVCRRGETRFRSQADVPAGWRSRRVVRNGRVAWCAKRRIIVDPPLIGPVCRRGETRFRSRARVPAGWISRRVVRNGRVAWCAKRRIIVDPPLSGPACRRNETRFRSRARIPAGWISRRVVRNGRVAWCAKRRIIVDPPLSGPACRRNETRFRNRASVPAGWISRRVVRNGRVAWCAKRRIIVDPPLSGPGCRRNERRFRNRASVPSDWVSRRVVRNGRVAWCAKRRPIVDPGGLGPVCRGNERRFRNRASIPSGWRVRRVVRNRKVAWCGRKRGKITVKPKICNPNQRRVGNRCVRRTIRINPNPVITPTPLKPRITPRPVAPQVKPRLLAPQVKPRLLAPRLIPELLVCPNGLRPRNGKCVIG